MNSGADKFGAKGRLVYNKRSLDEAFKIRDSGGGCESWRRRDRKDDIRGSVTRVKYVPKSPFASMVTRPW